MSSTLYFHFSWNKNLSGEHTTPCFDQWLTNLLCNNPRHSDVRNHLCYINTGTWKFHEKFWKLLVLCKDGWKCFTWIVLQNFCSNIPDLSEAMLKCCQFLLDDVYVCLCQLAMLHSAVFPCLNCGRSHRSTGI